MPVDGISQKAYAGTPEPRRLAQVTAGQITSSANTVGPIIGAKGAPTGATKARSDSMESTSFASRAISIPTRCAGLLADAVLLTLFAPFYLGWTAYRAVQRWRGKDV